MIQDQEVLYRFNLDCGRMGNLEGIFAATEKEVNRIIGQEVYFGEVLGKHSEITEVMEDNMFEILSHDIDKIDWLISIGGLSGYNPLNYLNEE